MVTAVLSVVIGRELGADLLGEQSLIAFGTALLGALFVESLTTSCIQSLASGSGRTDEELAGLRRWAVLAHIAIGIVAGAALYGYGLIRGDLVLAWLLVGVGTVVDAAGRGYAARVIALAGWGSVARRRLLAQLVAAGLGVTAVLAGLGVPGIFGANLIASLGLLLSLWRHAPKATRGSTPWFPKDVIRLWGLFAVGEVLTQIVAKRIEFFFLAAYSSGSEIAAYSISVMVVTSATMVPGSFAAAAMPAVAAAVGVGDEDRARRSLSRAIRVTLVASLALAALLAAVGPSLVLGLYGSDFSRAAQLVPLVAVSVIFVPAGALCNTYWAALGRIRLTLIAGMAGGVIDLAVAFALVPKYAAAGAVLASLAGQLTAAVAILATTWNAIGRFSFGRARWPSAIGPALVAAAAGRASANLIGGIPGALVGSVCCSGLYIAVLSLLARIGAPALAEEDTEWLLESLPRRLAVPLGRLLVPGYARVRSNGPIATGSDDPGSPRTSQLPIDGQASDGNPGGEGQHR